MQSGKQNFIGAFSAISFATAATLAAKSASAAITITPYYGNDQSGTTPNAVIIATDSIGDHSTIEDLTQGIVNTINMPLGDYLFMAVDAVATGDSNPDGGKRENATGITTKTSGSVVQPQYLGLSVLSVQVLSSDANARLLQPVVTNVVAGTYAGVTGYYSTASVNDTSGDGDNTSGYTAGNNSGGGVAPDWASVQSVGDVAPGVGSAATNDYIGGGNLPSASYTPFGVQKLQYFASSAASPSYGDATEVFDSLAYGTVGGTPGVVTLSPQIVPAGTGYWALSQPATTSNPSVYRSITVRPPVTVANLPPLVIDIGGIPASLTWNNAGATGPSDGVTWDTSNNNWNNGTNATAYSDGALVTFNDTNNGNYAVTLNTTVSPGLVTVNNSSGNYAISGSGSIAGAASLTKSGSGTLTLSTANAYDGGTTLNAGTLVVNNTTGSATGTGNVTLNGGVLASGITGLISGDVLAGTGSNTIAPGGVGIVGSLTIGGFTTTGGLTTLDFDLGTGTGIITNGDLLMLGAGYISIGSGTLMTFSGTVVPGDEYRLIGDTLEPDWLEYYDIPLSVFTLPVAPIGDKYSLSTDVDPGYVDLVVTAVPEPATASLLMIAGAGMLVHRRRKQLE
jgi:autotransporter-associated beta strand protein